MSDEGKIARYLRYTAAAWALFIAYGSWLPFEFQAQPLERGLSLFATGGGEVAYRSLTDQIVNLLLGLPLGFALCGGFARGRRAANLGAIVLTMAAAILLAATVEFGQTFLPRRSASVGDIIAQSVGAAVGIVCWHFFGGALVNAFKWVRSFKPSDSEIAPEIRAAGRAALLVYAACLLAVNGWFTGGWMNFDQAGDKFHQFHFAFFYNYYSASILRSLSSALFALGEYAVLASLLWLVSSGPRHAVRISALCGLTALVVESGKFFIANGSPDSTNALLAVVSAGLMCVLLPRVHGRVARFAKQPVMGAERDSVAMAPMVEVNRFRLIGYRVAAIGLFAMTVAAVLDFPLAPLWLLIAVSLYTVAQLRYPALWLVILPALLPSFDLAPWSGRFFLDEFDFLVLATIASGWWLAAPRLPPARLPGFLKALLGCLGLSACASLLIALSPLPPLDANAFASYFSRYSALRAVKGLAMAIALIPLIVQNLRVGVDVPRRLCIGMSAGLATVIAASLWERAMFPGLFDFTSDFRISALFSTMNTGDGPIEAYLVTALPLVFIWLAERRSVGTALLAVLGFVLGTYALFVTYSRGGYVAFVVMLLVLLVGNWLGRGAHFQMGKRLFLPLLVSLIVGAMAALIASESSFSRSRLAQSSADWGARVNHWRGVMALMDGDWRTTFFGMGLGRYPDTDRRKNWAMRMPSSYSYRRDGANPFLRLSAGAPAYLEQIVDLAPGEKYRIAVDMRAVTGPGTLNVMACERTFFRSYHCRDSGVWSSAAAAGWAKRDAIIDSGPLGGGSWPFRRTVKLILENTSRDSAVDIDNVSLSGRGGGELLANGDFSRGHDRWFYSSSDHLRWHIKNLWVQAYFEQGLVGVALFSMFIFTVMACLTKAALRADVVYAALLAGLVGFLCVGVFASPLDAPRLNFLFYLLGLVSMLGALAPAIFHDDMEAATNSLASKSALAPTSETIVAETSEAPVAHQPAWGIARLAKLVGQIVVGLFLFVAAAWLALQLPFVPYNVRGLLHPVHPLLSLLVFGVFLYWSAGFPVVIGHWLASSTRCAWGYPLLLTLHSSIGWFLLTYGVNFDRILKIIGTPVLQWHWYWEPAGRFVALFSVYSLLMTFAVLLVIGLVQRRPVAVALLAWAVTSAVLAPVLYWVVVTQAATDNLVELMAGGGTPAAAVWLSLFMVFLFGGGSYAAAILQTSSPSHRRWRLAALAFMISIPLAYLTLLLGTENALQKYGKVFSAMQFLLSPDRDQYVSGGGLWLRYVVVHWVVSSGVFVVQYQLFAWLSPSPQTNPGIKR